MTPIRSKERLQIVYDTFFALYMISSEKAFLNETVASSFMKLTLYQ
jgi:hypothetical protein